MNENRKYWLNSGLLTMAERFSSLILGFGSFFILVRTVNKDEFGIWSLFLSVTTLIELARNGLIQNALIKHLTTSEPELKKEIITASLALNVILTSISAALLYILAPILADYWHSPVLLPMYRFYIITTIVLIFFSQFNFIQQANLDFKGIFFSNLVRQAGFFFYILYKFLTNQTPDMVQMVNVQSICAIAGALLSVIFVQKYIEMSRTINWDWVKKLFHYGKFVFGTNISSVFFKTADQMILGNLRSTVEVGSYNAAARISNLFEVPVTSIATIVFPQSSKRIHEEGPSAAKQLYEKSVAVMLSIILPGVIFVCLFPKLILFVLTGKDYTDIAFVLQLVVIQNLFLPFLRQFGTILDSVGKPHVNFYFIIANAALNIGVNYFMISKYGLEGAALGSLIVYIFCTSFVCLYMVKNYNISIKRTLLNTFAFYPEIFRMLKSKIS
ncbi:MAG: flippase [Opitutaceae bacterium]|nr:flippase [Cytophagales bacterium]